MTPEMQEVLTALKDVLSIVNMSTDMPQPTFAVMRSQADALRQQADAIEQQDAAIYKARQVLRKYAPKIFVASTGFISGTLSGDVTSELPASTPSPSHSAVIRKSD